MATYLLWAIAGFILVIAELVTGTFYLLVLGVAALAGAAVAWAGGEFWLQVIVSSAMALIGTYLVHLWWQRRPKTSQAENSLEVGQTVIFESWINESHGTARVKYRGSSWDAKVTGPAKPEDVLTIQRVEQGILQVAP
jgi:membrane protein implicated in regulation of membrane protease activity